MRRNLLIRILPALVILAVASSFAHADNFMYFKKKAAAGGGGPEGGTCSAAYLVCQNFETATSGYDNGESWAEAGASGNDIIEAADTTATVLRGTQQLKIYTDNNHSPRSTSPSFTEQSDVWIYFVYKVLDASPTNSHSFVQVQDASSTNLVDLLHRTDGYVRAVCGTGVITTTGANSLSDNTKYHFWVHYTAGSGANAVYQVYWSTTGTKPASPQIDGSNGSRTTTATKIVLIANPSSAIETTHFYDHVLVKSSSIGDVAD